MIDDLHPFGKMILAVMTLIVPAAATYLLMDKSDDPRPEGRAER